MRKAKKILALMMTAVGTILTPLSPLQIYATEPATAMVCESEALVADPAEIIEEDLDESIEVLDADVTSGETEFETPGFSTFVVAGVTYNEDSCIDVSDSRNKMFLYPINGVDDSDGYRLVAFCDTFEPPSELSIAEKANWWLDAGKLTGLPAGYKDKIKELYTGTGIARVSATCPKVVMDNDMDDASKISFCGACYKGDIRYVEDLSLRGISTQLDCPYYPDKKLKTLKMETTSGDPAAGYNRGYVYVGANACEGCTSLTSVEISCPEDAALCIDDYAFDGCTALKSVKLPAKATGDITLNGSGEKTRRIGRNAFRNTGEIEEVRIPEGVVYFGYAAFLNSNVKKVYLSSSSCSSDSTNDYVFENCGKLEEVTFNKDCYSIGSHMFHNCFALTEVNLPEGLERIGYGAFKMELEETGSYEVRYDSHTYGTELFFESRSVLDKVTFGSNITFIGVDAFMGCPLRNTIVEIPDKCDTIGYGAFDYCLFDTFIGGNNVSVICDATGAEMGSPEEKTDFFYAAEPYCAIDRVVEFEDTGERVSYPASKLPTTVETTNELIKTLFKNTTNRNIINDTIITDDFDRWGFENAEDNYGNPENGYVISTQDYQKLTSGLDSVSKDTVTRELNVNLAGTFKRWFGSCYGMSASTISVNTNDITPAAMGISSETLMDVKTADSSYKKNKKDSIGAVESAINFFHVQQSLPEYQAVRDEFSQLSSAEQLSRVESLAKTAKSKPALLDIWWKNGNNIEGHSIVAKGWRKLGNSDSSSLRDKYKYCILTYDCSNPDLTGNTSDCNIYYNDEGQWEVPGWGITPSNAYMICGTNDISTFNPISYTSGEYRKATTPQTSIRAEASEWTVKWGENNRAEIVNGVIVQSTDDSLRILPTLTDTPVSQTEYKVNMPNNKEYSISSDKPLNHSVLTNDSITEIKTEGGASAVINNGDVAVNSNTDGIELRFVMNESPISENEAKIKASNAKELDVTQVENGFVVKGDDLTDVVFAEVKNNVENPKTLQTEDKSILITEKEGEVIAYSDKDGDGIHETEIKVEEKKCTIVLGQKINLRQTCFSDVTDTISRYAVNNTSLAGVSKEMLSGKKTGTVTVYAQKMISKNNYENIAECEVTILSKPKLKFTKNMTYVDQTVNGADFFLTEDIRTYGATYWESNKPGIVEVTDSEKGTLKAKSSGTAKITAYFGEKGKQGTFKVSANLAVKIPSYVKTEYSLQTGAKLPISMKNVNGAVDPEWITSEEGIARASAQRNSKGVKTGKALVEGVACGSTTLTATIDGQNYNCTIHVTAPEINKQVMILKVGKSNTVSLKKTKIPKANIQWISDNPEVAIVDNTGKITAIKTGNATIYTETGGIRNECHVTVQ